MFFVAYIKKQISPERSWDVLKKYVPITNSLNQEFYFENMILLLMLSNIFCFS